MCTPNYADHCNDNHNTIGARLNMCALLRISMHGLVSLCTAWFPYDSELYVYNVLISVVKSSKEKV